MKLENVCDCVRLAETSGRLNLFFSHCALYLALTLCSIIHSRAM